MVNGEGPTIFLSDIEGFLWKQILANFLAPFYLSYRDLDMLFPFLVMIQL